MSKEKEPRFFSEASNWRKGLSWYESHFPEPTPIRGESTPDYTKFPAVRHAPLRIYSTIPTARLIYLVRDPIERIISHYVDSYSFGRVHRSLKEELVNFESSHLVNCSRYYMQLEQYLEYFPREQILVLSSEDLRDDRQATLRLAFQFLEVDESFASPEWERRFYESSDLRRKTRFGYNLLHVADVIRSSPLRRYLPRQLMIPIRAFNAMTSRKILRPTLDGSLRIELVDYLRQDVENLRCLTGCQFEKWSL